MRSLTVVARFLALLTLYFAGMVGIVWAQGGDSTAHRTHGELTTAG